MNQRIFVSLGTAVLAAATLFACTAASQDGSRIETLFRDGMIVEVQPMDVPAEGVLAAPVFSLRYALFPDPADGNPFRGASAGDHVVWLKDGRLVPIHGLAYLSTDDSLDSMDGLIDPAFRLNEGSAAGFMATLQAIMGEDQFEPVPVETIQNDGNTWYFVNGDFLSYYKGFVVTVDTEGAVTDIAFELSMLDQDENG